MEFKVATNIICVSNMTTVHFNSQQEGLQSFFFLEGPTIRCMTQYARPYKHTHWGMKKDQ